MRPLIFFALLLSVASAGDKLILSNGPPPSLPKKPPSAPSSCQLQELYVIGLTTHDPADRHKAMLAWLDRTKCNADDYVLIWNSLPEWAGTSDSPALRAKVMEKAR